ncbi:MAG: rhodanese-like domain-containing protein [Acidimicrobiia bacterium]|nr:rhodanese-like domain-containing protein [Acidimicrobiia bacterium]
MPRTLVAIALLVSVLSAACGSSPAADEATAAGVRVVPVDEAAAIHTDPPADLVVLDVRTPDEYVDGHLDGAVVLDFYAPDFATDLAALDRDVPYLLYCQSGNRSGQSRQMMAELGFTDVADIEGGISAWIDAGHPVVTS